MNHLRKSKYLISLFISFLGTSKKKSTSGAKSKTSWWWGNSSKKSTYSSWPAWAARGWSSGDRETPWTSRTSWAMKHSSRIPVGNQTISLRRMILSKIRISPPRQSWIKRTSSKLRALIPKRLKIHSQRPTTTCSRRSSRWATSTGKMIDRTLLRWNAEMIILTTWPSRSRVFLTCWRIWTATFRSHHRLSQGSVIKWIRPRIYPNYLSSQRMRRCSTCRKRKILTKKATPTRSRPPKWAPNMKIWLMKVSSISRLTTSENKPQKPRNVAKSK